MTNALELSAAEFAFRGFLMLALVRVIGPLGVVVAALPFVFGHLGKPELELFSTLGGGLVYGWLAWRTRSIVWGAIGHTYILTPRDGRGRADAGQAFEARATSESSSTSMP